MARWPGGWLCLLLVAPSGRLYASLAGVQVWGGCWVERSASMAVFSGSPKWSQAEIGGMLGVSQPTIDRWLAPPISVTRANNTNNQPAKASGKVLAPRARGRGCVSWGLDPRRSQKCGEWGKLSHKRWIMRAPAKPRQMGFDPHVPGQTVPLRLTGTQHMDYTDSVHPHRTSEPGKDEAPARYSGKSQFIASWVTSILRDRTSDSSQSCDHLARVLQTDRR